MEETEEMGGMERGRNRITEGTEKMEEMEKT